MAYDEALADRVRAALEGAATWEEQAMFGGLAFLVAGHMAVAASGGGGLMVRCPPAEVPELLERPGVAPMEMRGRTVGGWLRVSPAALGTDEALEGWVAVGLAHVRTLAPKR